MSAICLITQIRNNWYESREGDVFFLRYFWFKSWENISRAIFILSYLSSFFFVWITFRHESISTLYEKISSSSCQLVFLRTLSRGDDFESSEAWACLRDQPRLKIYIYFFDSWRRQKNIARSGHPREVKNQPKSFSLFMFHKSPYFDNYFVPFSFLGRFNGFFCRDEKMPVIITRSLWMHLIAELKAIRRNFWRKPINLIRNASSANYLLTKELC